MSRVLDAVLETGKAYAGTSPALNVAIGGQNGIMPSIGVVGADGKNYDAWVSNAAYIKRNIIPIVIRYPKFFDLMPDKDKWIEAYKNIMELQALTIDGLSSGLTVDTDEHPVGAAGEFQEEATDVKRARSTISYTFKDKAGKSLSKYFDYYIRYGIMDPDTKRALVAQYITDINTIGGMYTPDYYTGTVLFIEPDITQKVVVDAWLCTNMFPKGNGDRTGKRDLRSAGETPELSIEFTSITMNNSAVMTLANKILSSLSVLSKLPDTGIVVPSSEIDSTLAAAKGGFNS